MDNHFEPLAIGEVLSIDESAQILIGHRTFRVGEFADAVKQQMQSIKGWTKDKDAWFSEEGISCEVLRFTANGWQKGKVRLHLEFCPQDFEDQPQAAAISSADSTATAVDTSDDELNLEDSLLDDSDDELNLENTLLDDSDELNLDDSDEQLNLENTLLDDSDDELNLENTLLDDSDDELNLDDSPLISNDELDSEDFAASLDDEFSLDQPENVTFVQVEEVPVVVVHEEQDIIILAGEELADEDLDFDSMSSSFDDDLDLGEISQSIDQELELVEATPASDDDLLDLGDMSLDGTDDLDFGEMSDGSEDDFQFDELSVGSDDDLDFGKMSGGSEDDFQFEDISFGNEPEKKDDDSLLDDVWQDLNQASGQNKP
ncbi:MAG: KGK domain-containing protein [Coleofasciculaceae cyanobacterium]